MGLFKMEIYFNRPINLEDLRQRIRADIIERSVQSIGDCQNG
jgi:hypothetical protein